MGRARSNLVSGIHLGGLGRVRLRTATKRLRPGEVRATPTVHSVNYQEGTNGGCESGRRIAPGEPLTQGGGVGGLDVPGHRYPVVLTDQLCGCRVAPAESLRKILYVKPLS